MSSIDSSLPPVSRRGVLAGSGVAAGTLALSGSPAFAARPGRKVAVLGGGMAGLTAAHELVERGFKVTVFEPSAWGGKARSIPVPNTARGGRRDLPGEHGFRFFPGFYHHVPNTMRRIPFGKGTVGDHLADATGGKFYRAGDRADGFIFGLGPDPEQVLTVDGMRRFLMDTLGGNSVPPQELAWFVTRLLVFLTSCEGRRFKQWEHLSWWDFVGANTRSKEYQTILASGLTRSLVAARADVASTRTIGNMGEAFIMNMMGRGNDGALDRVLDLPTNEAWINPWMRHLRRLGVKFVGGHRLVRYEVNKGRIEAAILRDRRNRRHRFEADWFVSAMPVERARETLTSAVLKHAPHLRRLDALKPDWMVGIQYFLREPIKLTHGHISFIDSPWALTALTQGQFWKDRKISRDYGDGKVRDILSVDISNWSTPGILYNKPAKQCSPAQIAREVLAQIRAHETAGAQLPDKIIHSWFLDPGVAWNPKRKRNTNATPLLINTVGSWDDRPEARSGIPNLLLSGDYVRTNIDLATMEGANESARAAVNAILDERGSRASRAEMFTLYKPAEFEALKMVDEQLYKLGLPNALDLPL
ncbi:FAD-dependent oxidoreductase [Nocardioides sp. Bht2]|uniref:hydroxysqualene dehydroxylase n=1 Tax=Nocardioides sp. Bht2 TaxID=3392297 RepID=UPI0039B440D4